MKDSIQIQVGKRIQEIRNEKNISQQDLAAKCNFEKSNMSRLEAGRANATLSTLETVSKALEINIIDFLCEKYKKEVAFDQWLKQFAQYREGHTGSLSDLLKNIAIQPPSKSLATRVLNDLSNTITSLNKSHLG